MPGRLAGGVCDKLSFREASRGSMGISPSGRPAEVAQRKEPPRGLRRYCSITNIAKPKHANAKLTKIKLANAKLA